MDWIGHLRTRFPDIIISLRPRTGDPDQVAVRGRFWPQGLDSLYAAHDGEDRYLGLFGGFSWMSLDQVNGTLELFSRSPWEERFCLGKGMIRDNDDFPDWVPFAEDGGGSYLALDYVPGPRGTVGQVITMDRDSREVCVLAPSFAAFCERLKEHENKGHIRLGHDEDAQTSYLEWFTGHLFNDLALWSRDKASERPIRTTDYWTSFFKEDAVNGKVPAKVLQSLSMVVIRNHAGPVSLDLLTHCTRLTELIIHQHTLKSLKPLQRIPHLRKLVVPSTNRDGEIPSVLQRCAELRELTLLDGRFRSLDFLRSCPLTSLRLVRTSIENPDSIAALPRLKELGFSSLAGTQLSWIGTMHRLRRLEVESMPVGELGWISNLKQLRHLKLPGHPGDPALDAEIAGLDSLEETDWPFSDMGVLAGNTRLRSIGVNAGNVRTLEALGSTRITSVHVANSESHDHAEAIIKDIKRYLDLRSWGY